MQTIENYFVCVGVQKAGTTWLARVLDQHEDLFVTPVKEIHYFDHIQGITSKLSAYKRQSRMRKYLLRFATDWSGFAQHRSQWPWYRAYMRDPIDDDWYANLFRYRGAAHMAGEVTPEYALIGADGFAHIDRLAPEARVLFILRNPVWQAWSQFLHFDGKPGRRPAPLLVADAIAFLSSDDSAPHRDYARIIDDLVGVFGDGRLKVLFYEDMHADRAATLASICDFLGVDFQDRQF